MSRSTCSATRRPPADPTPASSASATPTTTPAPTVDPTITTDRGTALAGDQVQVAATGFKPGSTVAFYLHSVRTFLRTAKADASGDVGATVTIPDGTIAGEHRIEASGIDGSGAALSLERALVVKNLAATDTIGASADGGSPPVGALVLIVLGAIGLAAAAAAGRGRTATGTPPADATR